MKYAEVINTSFVDNSAETDYSYIWLNIVSGLLLPSIYLYFLSCNIAIVYFWIVISMVLNHLELTRRHEWNTCLYWFAARASELA